MHEKKGLAVFSLGACVFTPPFVEIIYRITVVKARRLWEGDNRAKGKVAFWFFLCNIFNCFVQLGFS